MKNRGFLILLILVIFCMGVSIGSASANENDFNITNSENDAVINFQNEYCINQNNSGNEECSNQQFNEFNIIMSDGEIPTYYEEITIVSKDYTKYDNYNPLEFKLKYPQTSIKYTICDEKNNVVYRYTFNNYMNANTTYSLDKNYSMFKDLNPGTYTCKLLVNGGEVYAPPDHYKLVGVEFSWTVVNPAKTKEVYDIENDDGEYEIIDSEITSQTNSKSSINSKPKTKTTTVKKSRPVKYIKVGKYKIKVWADDSLNTRKNKVIKYLNKHVKKPHTFKIKGYKFKVSAKMYRKILYYKKFGYDGKVGYSNFKVKTNKVIKYKMPIFETRKYTKYVWKYIKVLSGSSRWGDGWSDYTPYDNSRYYKNGWKYYGSYNEYYSRGVDTYSKLKKKVKTTITKDVKVGYKTVKLRVYAWGVETHLNVGVQFRGTGHGYKNLPLTSYYMF